MAPGDPNAAMGAGAPEEGCTAARDHPGPQVVKGTVREEGPGGGNGRRGTVGAGAVKNEDGLTRGREGWGQEAASLVGSSKGRKAEGKEGAEKMPLGAVPVDESRGGQAQGWQQLQQRAQQQGHKCEREGERVSDEPLQPPSVSLQLLLQQSAVLVPEFFTPAAAASLHLSLLASR